MNPKSDREAVLTNELPLIWRIVLFATRNLVTVGHALDGGWIDEKKVHDNEVFRSKITLHGITGKHSSILTKVGESVTYMYQCLQKKFDANRWNITEVIQKNSSCRDFMATL